MSMVHRATGRTNSNKPNKADTNSNVTKNVKTETVVKIIEKEKKQPTPEQMRLASLTDRGEMQNTDNIPDKIIKIVEFTHKTEDEVLLALHDCGYNEQEAITNLLEGKAQGWSDPVTKKKKSRTASASKNDAEANNGDVHENNADWDKEANTSSNHHGERSNRGFRGARRDRGGRRDDRGSFHDRKWKGRENKENERHNEEGVSGRDYRGRGDRLTNGPSRMGRGGRGSRGGGRGPGGSRTFQSRDGNDRGGGGGGFPRQIDTWNNPETENATSKADEFPSPEDWDNEEYTGSLADTKVFTPSTAVEPETADTSAPVETEIKDESIPMHMNIQSQPNAPIPSMVVGSNQLTPAQTQYFNQLAAQGKQTQQQSVQSTQPKSQVQQPSTSVIYNSSITSPQQGFVAATTQASSFASGASQSYASVTPSQSFTAMVSSQTFQQSPPVSYQSPSTMSGSVSYSRTNSEYTSSNYSDVISNYNSMVGLQTNGALPQRNKPQRPTSRQETPTKVIPGNVDIPSADGSMNSAMKYLDAQFSAALDFNNATDNYDSSTTTNDQASVAALSNKFGQNVSGSATPHSDLTAINTFQATQSKQTHSSTNISSVLNQTNKLPCESAALQNGSSVYSYSSSQTNTNSLSAPSVGGGGGGGGGTDVVPSLSYGIGETYQTQLQTSNAASSSVSSYHPSVVGTSITSTASNVYSNPQTQQTPQQPTSQVSQPQPSQQQSQTQQQAPPQTQQQPQPPQQQSQISSGVTYPTNNTTTSFSVYSSNNHSVATATPPLHNSVYHSSSYQPHPSVTASFQSYMSYPSSIIQPYQAGAAGLTQTPYLGTAQYGGGSLPSLGATYGAAFHNNYGVNSGLQTPVATLQQNHKMSNSLSTNASSKDSQYDGLQAITSVSGSSNSATTTTGSVMSGLSQAPTTTSSKVSSSSSAGSKSTGMLPSIPPGVTPLLGPAGPQYIMSQPLYQPAFSLNYDELQYLPRGIPHMPAAYLDLNYATAQQTNLATTGRETLNVPFSSISDGRYTRPDNTTSPVPPSGATAGASLSQQNTAPTHQQQHVPMLQTYATAYIYPPYQQYTAPVYQVAPTATPTAPGASTNAISGTPFGKAPAGYNSTGYTSQYDSLSSNQSSGADYSGKGSSSNAYSSNQQPSKSSGSSGSVSGQSSNVNSADLSMYGKSHASLTKNYDNKSFHSGTPPPFTMTGSGSTSSNVGNLSSVGGAATGYGPQLYIPNVPTAAATAAHHLHQNSHHQDGADMRNSGTSDRNFFLSSNRPSYR